jgi:glycosyltransferase involved in cell wall biosynthesis
VRIRHRVRPDRNGADRTVMLVSFAEVFGGAERSLLTLAKHLPQHGWPLVLACPPGPLAQAAREAGVRVVDLSLRRHGTVGRGHGGTRRYSAAAALGYVLAMATNARRVAQGARQVDAAFIHSNSLSSHLTVAVAGRIAGRPVGWHLREITRPGRGRAVLNAFSKLASGVVAISTAVAAVLDHDHIVVVANPVEEPPPDITKAPWSVPKPVIGYLGRITPDKGVEELVRAAAFIDAHVVVVGDPPTGQAAYSTHLHELAAAIAPGRIHFVGSVPDPWQALAVMDVLVVPSRAEPWGRVAAEAQRAGVPVLAANAGGLPDIVTDRRDGLLFPPQDPQALGILLREVLGDRQLREQLAAAGRTSAARYDPARHAAAMADFFDHRSSGDSKEARTAEGSSWWRRWSRVARAR